MAPSRSFGLLRLSLVLGLGGSAWAHADEPALPSSSFLWQVQSQPPSYLFGTIHVPYTRVWDAIPDNAKLAFKYSNKIYFELDLTNHATLTALSYCQLLPHGQHLSQILPSELYLRLKHHLDYVREAIQGWITPDQIERGLEADYVFATMTSNWERKQPVWVMMMLNTLTRSDIASRGIPVLDLYLLKWAEKQNKTIGAIEKVQEQCQPLNQLSWPKVIFTLNQTLTAHEQRRFGKSSLIDSYSTDNLIQQYRKGNIQSDFFSQDTFQLPILKSQAENRMTVRERKISSEVDQFFQDELIFKRNKRMAARVIDLLVNRPDSYFFAFGAGHFLGNHSILKFVRSAGFAVKRINPNETLDFSYAFLASPNAKNKVQGTFDDLSEHEKTRALLQFLQYHQQQERENDTRKFGEMIGPNNPITPVPPSQETDIDEKAIEESLKIWYGINEGQVSGSNELILSHWITLSMTFVVLILIL